MKYTLLICLLITFLHLGAQTKQEKEFRVDQKEVPTSASQWLHDTFDKTKKLKWHFEENAGKQSYEAKFCFRKRKYSVEFSTAGNLEDIEIEHKWRKLPKDIRQILQQGFNQIAKFNLKRIQEQWTGSSEDLQRSIQQNKLQNITIRYEVEFTGEIDGKVALWEGLFNDEGQLLQHRQVILSPTDNLDF